MGNSNGQSGDISDVDFFARQRNDVPVQPAQPSAMHREVYTNYVPQQPGGVPGRDCPVDPSRVVTIRDGQNIIYAQPGSTININEGGYRVGGQGQRGFMPNYDDTNRQLQAQRMMQWEMQTGYRPQPQYYPNQDPNCYRGGYRNIGGNGWEMPPPRGPYYGQHNGAFIGAQIGPFRIGFNVGGNRGSDCYGGGGYNQGGYNQSYYRPQMPYFRPPFYGHRRGGGGLQINAQLYPSWQQNNQNYYNGDGYDSYNS